MTLEIFDDFRTAEYPYGDKDQSGEFTLQTGDLVEFQVATDRRDKLAAHRVNDSIVEYTG